jgi:hypothetical protein
MYQYGTVTDSKNEYASGRLLRSVGEAESGWHVRAAGSLDRQCFVSKHSLLSPTRLAQCLPRCR